jgi:hypothetical protein
MKTPDPEPPNDGGSAFPWQVVVNPGSTSPFSGRTMPKDQMEMNIQVGMTLCDYFAAKSMQSLLRAQVPDGVSGAQLLVGIGKTAYDMADAMIAERKRRNETS